VTDANLVLGYVNPSGLAGGVSLSVERAAAVLQRDVAGPLGIDLTAAARAVHDLANASMASAIRVVTVQRGVDPRGFTLVAFGGAGPTHVTGLAETFGITSIALPWAAGVASAIGLVSADLGVERVRTWICDVDGVEPAELEAVFADLESACREELGGGEIVVHRAVDARFLGQAHQLVVPVDDLADVAAAFRKEHARAYGVDAEGPVELVNVRVRATRLAEKPAGRPESVVAGADPSPARRGERQAHLGGAFGPVPVYAWEALPPGAAIGGPVLIDAADTTVVVPPEWRAKVDGWRNVLLDLEGIA
jgi:N-methylhydantoinase A